MLTKLRLDSTWKMTLIVPVAFRYFEVATSVQDSSLLSHRKWHEVCWRLPSDSLQWSRWSNVSQCEGGEENLTIHSVAESGLMCCVLHQAVKILHLDS